MKIISDVEVIKYLRSSSLFEGDIEITHESIIAKMAYNCPNHDKYKAIIAHLQGLGRWVAVYSTGVFKVLIEEV